MILIPIVANECFNVEYLCSFARIGPLLGGLDTLLIKHIGAKLYVEFFFELFMSRANFGTIKIFPSVERGEDI